MLPLLTSPSVLSGDTSFLAVFLPLLLVSGFQSSSEDTEGSDSDYFLFKLLVCVLSEGVISTGVLLLTFSDFLCTFDCFKSVIILLALDFSDLLRYCSKLWRNFYIVALF